MAQQLLLPRNATCHTVGSHPPGSSADSYIEFWSRNFPNSNHESPTLSPLCLIFFSLQNLPTKGLAVTSVHILLITNITKWLIQHHPQFSSPPWSTEARKRNTLH